MPWSCDRDHVQDAARLKVCQIDAWLQTITAHGASIVPEFSPQSIRNAV